MPYNLGKYTYFGGAVYVRAFIFFKVKLFNVQGDWIAGVNAVNILAGADRDGWRR